ncbi:Transposase IS200 like protein [Legionella quinlivanii]|uniref:Transposase IS200 like protein n=1 Tax=Legionella quinlivanii TaxID=45073 RepID=A0A0W0XTL4_9GAMM|nr:transposase [Legionella quinlivanii]KTD47914.1 Transposase IS200 like protein [Legionella quinlivanii]SEG36841.1 putative transposase [Legionella quinlivanii DSM 21216]STY10092.1 Transposase and inactivated derivatives [Legionella quinlivanii]
MRYRRVIIPGATYFFTVNLQNRSSKLLIEHIDVLRTAFRRSKHYYPFVIDAIVILPDHLHIIMTLPENDGNFSLRWNLIKGIFSRQLPINELISPIQKNRRERGIWQKRFWEHLIRDDLDIEHYVNYIHYNPVKHGHVAQPVDWPYSSIHRFVKNGILPSHWTVAKPSYSLDYGEK